MEIYGVLDVIERDRMVKNNVPFRLYLELGVDVWLKCMLRYIISHLYHLSVSDLNIF